MEIDQIAVSRISTWLWQKCNPELPKTTTNLDLIHAQAKELWELIKHYPTGNAGSEVARAIKSQDNNGLTPPDGSKSSIAAPAATTDYQRGFNDGLKGAFSAADVVKEMAIERESTHQPDEQTDGIEDSVRFGLVNAEPFSVEEVIRLAVAHFSGNLPIERSPEQNPHSPVEISNVLHRLNLDRPDIAELPEGATVACNVTTLRQAADLIRKLAAAVADIDAEIAIAEGIQLIPEKFTYEQFGTPVLSHLKSLGYRIVKVEEQGRRGRDDT